MTTAINKTIHQCDKCKKTFDAQFEANKCEASHIDISHFSIAKCSKQDDENVEKNEYQPYWPNIFYIESKLHGMTGIYRFERFEMLYDKDRK